jgi:hypothetical protein
MRTRALIVGVLVAIAGIASAQIPIGGEFLVNTVTSGDQSPSGRSIAMAPDGTFFVVWESGNNAMAQRFDALGVRQGPEFQVNPVSGYSPVSPIVVADGRGEFVVAWTHGDSPDYGPWRILVRRYFGNGAPDGLAIHVSADTHAPDVAADAAGNFVVVWNAVPSTEIVGRRYDTNGLPVGGEFAINTYTPGLQTDASVDYDASGRFVVAWRSTDQDGSNGIFARRFDAAGMPQGPEFLVNSSTTGFQSSPRVAVDPSGAFLIAWVRLGGHRGIFARRFDATGAPLGEEFRVDTSAHLFPGRPLVASDDAGNATITWTTSDGGNADVAGRLFDASGAARGGEFRINTYTTGNQFDGSVAMDSAGSFVVAWGSVGQDGAGSGVVARRFIGLRPAALAVDGGGNGILEMNEVGVVVAPAWESTGALTIASLSGVAGNFTGPAGATYTLDDGTASYGALGAGATASCISTGNCYAVTVAASTRPAVHWDAAITETLTPTGVTHERPLHIGGSFDDVPVGHRFYPFVEAILHKNVTGGCAPSTYCPSAVTSREQMAVFVLVASQPAGYVPPPCGAVPRFQDVPATNPFCPWIEDLQRRRISDGCAPFAFCPSSPTTREQMAVFVLKTLGASVDPPACVTPMFADVPASSPFCRWIEELARRGVVTGCGGGNYCPAGAVTREQMAVFLTVTFGLTLYGA